MGDPMMYVPPFKDGVLHDLPALIARYRHRAEELRAQAFAGDSEGTRETLLHVADSYDKMADRLANIARASGIELDVAESPAPKRSRFGQR